MQSESETTSCITEGQKKRDPCTHAYISTALAKSVGDTDPILSLIKCTFCTSFFLWQVVVGGNWPYSEEIECCLPLTFK